MYSLPQRTPLRQSFSRGNYRKGRQNFNGNNIKFTR